METTDSPTYTPLPEARITEPVEIDMASLGHYIPEWAGREKIGVNMEVLAEVARIMRMRSLTVLGMRGSGEEEIVAQRVFEDGSATGTASGTVTFQNRVSDNGPKPFWGNPYETDCGRAIDFRDFVIRLNLAALEHRIANSTGPVRDSTQWAEFINQEVGEELKKLAWKRFKPDSQKIAFEILSPFTYLYYRTVLPVIEALKGRWDTRALIGTIIIPPTCILIASQNIVSPKELAILFYLYFMLGAKHEEWMKKGTNLVENHLEEHQGNSTEPYDPVTPLTFANFEWDRLLGVHHLLSRYKLITLLEEIESPTKNQ